ncbi:hypothetical protein V5799_004119 [Amblyomma americanum]|uniref:Uncharacterized protein n=1 Tax=Amblyomma americanum TaxID=6943 RepID=A0AAQ4D710_AMBAM
MSLQEASAQFGSSAQAVRTSFIVPAFFAASSVVTAFCLPQSGTEWLTYGRYRRNCWNFVQPSSGDQARSTLNFHLSCLQKMSLQEASAQFGSSAQAVRTSFIVPAFFAASSVVTAFCLPESRTEWLTYGRLQT